MKIKLILLLAFSLQLSAFAQIIPSTRTVTWEGNVGIPGGIPNSSNMITFVSVSAGNMNQSYLQTQIDNCPSNQVIQLPAGSFNIGYLNFEMNHGVVLRGAGMGVTRLNGSHIYMGQAAGTPVQPLVTAGATKGSTSVTVASATGFRVNDFVVFEGGDDTDIVFLAGEAGGAPANQPCQKQVCKITSVSGTTIGITPPLCYTMKTSGALNGVNVRAVIYNNLGATPNFVSKCGVENLTLNLDTGWDFSVDLHNVAYCWFSNVEMYNASHRTFYIQRGFGCELFKCFIHDSTLHGPFGYGITLEPASACLIANNIVSNVTGGFQVNEGSSGNVFAYNYVPKSQYTNPQYTQPDFQNHYAHPVMNLWEGNYGFMIYFDDIHGSSSHHTVFRNRFVGWQNSTILYQQYCTACATHNKYVNFVGNVLGDVPGQTVHMNTYLTTTENNTQRTIFALNVDNGGTDAGDTVFIHGNWDSVNGAIMWDARNSTNSTKVIPNSYYLSAKPTWWGNLAWPPYNPSNVTAAGMSPTNIPAGYRSILGSDPSNTNGSVAPVITSSTTATCTNFVPFTYQITTLLNNATSYGQTNLPSGVGLNAASGAISGSPDLANSGSSRTVGLFATNGTGTAYTNLTLTIVAEGTPKITSATNVSAAATALVSYTIAGTWFPNSFGAASLPSGLSVNSANGVISGSVTTPGEYDATITATNQANLGAVTNLHFSVASGPAVLAMQTNRLVFDEVGSGLFGTNTFYVTNTGGATLTGFVTNDLNLVLALGFEEGSGSTATDASVYGNNGSIVGATYAPGRYGTALYFPTNSGTTMLTVPYSTSIDVFTNGITLEAWLYPMMSKVRWSTIFFHGDEDNNNVEYILNGTTTTAGRPSFWALNTGQFMGVSLPVSNWVHVACTYNGSTRIIYTNGVIATSISTNGGPMQPNPGFPLTIGGNTFFPAETWGGRIDEVRIYNRALSIGEIQANAGIPVSASAFTLLSGTNLSIAGNSSAAVQIKYSPTSKGTNTSSFTIVSSGGNSSLMATGVCYPMSSTWTNLILTNALVQSAFNIETNNCISQTINTTNFSAANGRAVWGVVITNEAYYGISATVNAPSTSANSVFINVDAPVTEEVLAHQWMMTPTIGFEDRLVTWDSDQALPPPFAHPFFLTAGTHKVIVYGREAGTQLRSLTVFPIGPAPDPTNVVEVIAQPPINVRISPP